MEVNHYFSNYLRGLHKWHHWIEVSNCMYCHVNFNYLRHKYILYTIIINYSSNFFAFHVQFQINSLISKHVYSHYSVTYNSKPKVRYPFEHIKHDKNLIYLTDRNIHTCSILNFQPPPPCARVVLDYYTINTLPLKSKENKDNWFCWKFTCFKYSTC